MAEGNVGRIVPGQELCDINGDKVGTIAHVYREDAASEGPGAMASDEVIEVKTGLLGLGQKLYVPVVAVSDTTEAAVFVAAPKDEFDPTWREKPENLEQLR